MPNNLEKIKKFLDRISGKFILERGLPFALAATVIMGPGMTTAKAVNNMDKPSIEITSSDIKPTDFIVSSSNDLKYTAIKTNYNETMKIKLKVPCASISYSDSAKTKPNSISNAYTEMTISKINFDICQRAIDEIDTLYKKLEDAANRGNYTVKSGKMSINDVLVSLNGDVNHITESIKEKYSFNNQVQEVIISYINDYKKPKLFYAVYTKNNRNIEYDKLTRFCDFNTVNRSKESSGYVTYLLNNGTYSVNDSGYFKTTSITASSQASLKKETITFVTGYNLYVDGIYTQPVDANNKAVDLWAIKTGTSYLPIRYITSLFGYEINYDPANHSATLYSNELPTEEVNIGHNKTVTSVVYPTVNRNNNVLNSIFKEETSTVYTGITLQIFDGKATKILTYNGKPIELIAKDGTIFGGARAVSEAVLTEYSKQASYPIISYDSEEKAIQINRPGQYNPNATINQYESGLYETEAGERTPVSDDADIHWGDMSPESGAHYLDPETGTYVPIDNYDPPTEGQNVK